MKKLLYLILLSSTCSYGATVANVQKLSSFGSTNSITTNDLITMSVQPGTVNEALRGITFGDFLTQFHLQEGYVNALLLGLRGDGVTDNTAILQAAINRGANIILPYSTNGYVSGCLRITNTCYITGLGGRSKLLFNNASNGWFINASNSQNVVLKDLDISGQSNVTFRTVYPTAGTRGGVLLNPYGNNKIQDCYIHGFSQDGILLDSTNTSINPAIVARLNSGLRGIDIQYCQTGLRLGDNSAAEYQQGVDCRINQCYNGVYTSSGNFNFIGFTITECSLATAATGAGNNSHGNFNSCLINHNDYPIYMYNINVGINYVGCQIFTGQIYCDGSSGVNISHGELDVDGITFVNGGTSSHIEGNYCQEGLANSITNAGGSTVCSIWNNRKRTSGTWLGTPGFFADGKGTNLTLNGGFVVTNGVNFSGSVSNVAGIGQTANRWAGRGRLTAGQQTYIVTNSIVTANTIAIATLSTNDATATSISATPTAGFLTLKANAAATGNADISWLIVTP